MRTICVRKSLCFFLSALLCFSGMTGFFSEGVSAAEEETELPAEISTESVAEAGTESETPVEPEIFEVIVNAEGETQTIENDTSVAVSNVTYEFPAAEEETETADGEAESETTAGTLTVTEENGITHLFEEADLTTASDYSIIEKLSFFFIKGTNSSGEEVWFYETADDITLDEPVKMYTVGMVNIREEPDGNSALVATADRGSEVEVTGGTSKWFTVTQDDVTGYLAARYLTENEEEAEAAVEAEATARAAIEAAAAAQAAAEAAAAQSYSSSSSSGSGSSKSEVSREAVYDCDGSGHGYYEITYSDGSVGYVDF